MTKTKTDKVQDNEAKAEATFLLNRISILDARLGVGVGAKRERERLANRLAKYGKIPNE